MDIDLPEQLLEMANRYRNQADTHEQEYRAVAAELAQDNVLETRWFTEEKLPIAIDRCNRLKVLNGDFIVKFEQHNVGLCGDMFALADQQPLEVRDKIVSTFLLKIAFSCNQFKLYMILIDRIIDESLQFLTFMTENLDKFQVDGDDIQFHDEQMLKSTLSQLESIGELHQTLTNVDTFDFNQVRESLNAMSQSCF